MTALPSLVLPTAARIRTALEELAVLRRWPTHLGGLCSVASRALQEELHEAGVRSRLRDGRVYIAHAGGVWVEPHTWNEVEDLVVDLTATQFASRGLHVERVQVGVPTGATYKPETRRRTRRELRRTEQAIGIPDRWWVIVEGSRAA